VKKVLMVTSILICTTIVSAQSIVGTWELESYDLLSDTTQTHVLFFTEGGEFMFGREDDLNWNFFYIRGSYQWDGENTLELTFSYPSGIGSRTRRTETYITLFSPNDGSLLSLAQIGDSVFEPILFGTFERAGPVDDEVFDSWPTY
jgi:hypothetical protein